MHARARSTRLPILVALVGAVTLVAACATSEERTVVGVTVPPPLSTMSTVAPTTRSVASTVPPAPTTERPTTTLAPTTTFEPPAAGPASSVPEAYVAGGGRRPRVPCTPGPDLGQLVLGANCRHVVIDGMAREYLVYVPSTVTRDVPAPLVVFLHGDDRNGDDSFRDTGWKRRADERGLVLAFPTSLEYDALGTEAEGWTFRWAGYELDEQVVLTQRVEGYPIDSPIPADDSTFIQTMIDDIEYQWPIDPARVFVAGFQGGAELATKLLIDHPDTFAAAALTAGGLASRTFELPVPARSVPILLLLGTDDVAFASRATTELGSQIPLDSDAFRLSEVGQFVLQRLTALSGTDQAAATATTEQHLTTFEMTGGGIGGGQGLVRILIVSGLANQYPQLQNNLGQLIGSVEINNFFDEVSEEA